MTSAKQKHEESSSIRTLNNERQLDISGMERTRLFGGQVHILKYRNNFYNCIFNDNKSLQFQYCRVKIMYDISLNVVVVDFLIIGFIVVI